MKFDFLARPVKLSREDKIKSHFVTCFMVLFIYKLLEKDLDYKYTISLILNTLRNMEMVEQKKLGYEPIYARTMLTNLKNGRPFLGFLKLSKLKIRFKQRKR